MAESEFMRRLRERAEVLTAPHRDIYGDDAPAVRIVDRLVQAAEEIDQDLAARRVSTIEASNVTGWSVETLQKWARAKLNGEPVPTAWANLDVAYDGNAYTFVLGSIPANPRAVA